MPDNLPIGYPQTFTWGRDCPDHSEWCAHKGSHRHGFDCDKTCPCRLQSKIWRVRA